MTKIHQIRLHVYVVLMVPMKANKNVSAIADLRHRAVSSGCYDFSNNWSLFGGSPMVALLIDQPVSIRIQGKTSSSHQTIAAPSNNHKANCLVHRGYYHLLSIVSSDWKPYVWYFKPSNSIKIPLNSMKLKFILIFKPVPGPETRAAAVHVRTFADGGCRKKNGCRDFQRLEGKLRKSPHLCLVNRFS